MTSNTATAVLDGTDRTSVTALFAGYAQASPDAIALRGRAQHWTYAQLDRQSDRLARILVARGVRPGDRVALLVERSPAAVCALLAVLKAGAAYVPLDLDYPCAQRAAMIEDCAPAAVIRGSGVPIADALAWRCPTIVMQPDGSAPGESEDSAPLPGAGPGDVAYVMYTSGSTGRPKGVVVPHCAVVRLVRGADYARFDADEVILQLAPLAFDAATLEIWAPLLNGGQVAFADVQRPSLGEIGALVREYGVTTLWLTAGLFNLMVDAALDDLAGLRQLLSGGDVLSPAHVCKALAALPDCRLINGYGPTENTTFTCCYTIPRDQPADAIPIGYPIHGTQVYILDEALRPVPEGMPGQLCAGGDGVALGYLNRPDLTAERFRPDPFSADPEARLYLTGDLARRRPDGALEFLGRLDTQVKIDGKRVELGEIETALRAVPGIRDAAVTVEQTGPQAKCLHAFVVGADGASPDPAVLRAELAGGLPAHMRPSTITVLPSLPLNPNGKVDRTALTATATAARDAERRRASGPAPRSETELRIAAVWKDVLGIDSIAVDDNFFDLGGTSLRLLAVHQRLATLDLGTISVVDLFARPTIRALAEFLGGASRQNVLLGGAGSSRAALQAAALKRLSISGRSMR
ncbi:amino acid adenylation domain-containing protein [Bradyrhizobium sp. P5_C11_2]